MRRLALALACLVPLGAEGHPHVFIDGGVDFLGDDQGRVGAVRITWIYDEFTTLYVLQNLKFDADGDGALTAEERRFLVEDQTTWEPGFDGDGYLFQDGQRVALGGPTEGEVDLVDGRLKVTFRRALAAPQRPAALTAKLYDPAYYYAYAIVQPPKVDALPGCRATLIPFVADTGLAALQSTLSGLSANETPEQQDVGALFADQVRLTCD